MNKMLEKLKRTMSTELKDSYVLLGEDGSTDDVEHWVSTGNTSLDYCISNRRNGGLPVGKIVEISGMQGSGKSLMAMHICANTQKMGGLPIYLDPENGFQKDFAQRVGLNTNEDFWYPEPPPSVEAVFRFLFELGHQIDDMKKKGEFPYKFVTVVWDSVASTPAEEDVNSENPNPAANMGLKPRVLSKNFSLFLSIAAKKSILLVCLNQLRNNLRALPFQDPYITPGGNAIPFYASTRVRLLSGGKLRKGEAGEVVGINTFATVEKTRFGPPHRKSNFPIYFTHGIDDAEAILNSLIESGGAIKASGGRYGTLLYLKGETKENAIPKIDWKKKFMTDNNYREKVLDAFANSMSVDLTNPAFEELEVDKE